MARSFNGSNQRVSAPLGVTLPFSCSAWIKAGAATGVVVGFSNASGTHRHLLRKTGATQMSASSTVASVATAQADIATPASGWYHVAAIWRTTTARSIYVNGARANNTGSVTPTTTPGEINIGVGRIDGAYSAWLNCEIAAPAYWNVELNDAEIASLAAGVRPEQIRPQNLISYQLFDPRILDAVAGNLWTNSGSTDSNDHPPLR